MFIQVDNEYHLYCGDNIFTIEYKGNIYTLKNHCAIGKFCTCCAHSVIIDKTIANIWDFDINDFLEIVNRQITEQLIQLYEPGGKYYLQSQEKILTLT